MPCHHDTTRQPPPHQGPHPPPKSVYGPAFSGFKWVRRVSVGSRLASPTPLPHSEFPADSFGSQGIAYAVARSAPELRDLSVSRSGGRVAATGSGSASSGSAVVPGPQGLGGLLDENVVAVEGALGVCPSVHCWCFADHVALGVEMSALDALSAVHGSPVAWELVGGAAH